MAISRTKEIADNLREMACQRLGLAPGSQLPAALEQTLMELRDGRRPNMSPGQMAEMIRRLNPGDMVDDFNYIQKPRVWGDYGRSPGRDMIDAKIMMESMMGIDPARLMGYGVAPNVKEDPMQNKAAARQRIEELTYAVKRLQQEKTEMKEEAEAKIKEVVEVLERVQKEPLILYRIDRMSKDNKHAYVKKQDTDLRIEACPDLEQGDEVLLHPKTFQIVERVGKPPLEVSRFSPDKIPDVKWEDIGGLEQAKVDMIEAIELPHKNKDLFKFYNKKPVKGILLSGPPGCGKTMLGKAAANSLATMHDAKSVRSGFLYVKGPEVLNMYVGASEQTIRDMFDDARRHQEEHGYPAIIFLDEADAILAARGGRSVGIGNTIVPQFLTEMDGLEESAAIVIIATNRPDVLDPAIVRDGRIDRKVTVTRPTRSSAKTIIELNLEKVPVAKGLTKADMAELAVDEIYSDTSFARKGLLMRDAVNGAMLANCVSIAVSSAIQRDMMVSDTIKSGSGVSMDDVRTAIERVRQQSEHVRHDLETDY